MIESRIRSALVPGIRWPVFGLLGALWPHSSRLPKPLRLKTIFENLSIGNEQAFYNDLVWLRADTRKRLYADDFMRALHGFTPEETVHPFYAGCNAGDALSRAQATDIQFYMSDDVLVKVDRMSMAHSMEIRSPLLDHHLMEFAAQLPTHLKISGQKGKLLLRELASRRLPPEIHKKPKLGFSIPAASWLRNELKPLAQDIIFGSGRVIGNFLKREPLTRLWQEHQSGLRDHHVLLWGLLMLGLWEEVHVTGGNRIHPLPPPAGSMRTHRS